MLLITSKIYIFWRIQICLQKRKSKKLIKINGFGGSRRFRKLRLEICYNPGSVSSKTDLSEYVS